MSIFSNGFEIVDSFLNAEELLTLNEQLRTVVVPAKAGGIRNVEKKFSTIASFIRSSFLLDAASKYLIEKPCFVRAILFDKSEKSNWFVTWHQDRIISVSKRFDQDGWGPWSEKDGVLHVQPSIEVLNQMVTIRIHLDDSGVNNGCLKVISGSQKQDLLPPGGCGRDIEKYTLGVSNCFSSFYCYGGGGNFIAGLWRTKINAHSCQRHHSCFWRQPHRWCWHQTIE